MKKALSLLLALCLVFAICGAALAENDYYGTWQFNRIVTKDGTTYTKEQLKTFDIVFTANANGTFSMSVSNNGQVAKGNGTWKANGNKVTVTDSSTSLLFTLSNDQYSYQDPVGTIYLAHTVKGLNVKPAVNSVEFAKDSVTVKQDVDITAVTSTNATQLNMYAGSTLIQSWTTGYTDNSATRTWKVKYAFNGAGDKTMSFRAVNKTGTVSDAKKADITVTAEPAVKSVKFASPEVALNRNVTITAVTNTVATKLSMYSDDKLIKTWSSGYTDDGTTRTWKVVYAFAGAGNRTLAFKAKDANGVVSAAKSATIVVAAKPTLTSVKFGAAVIAIKQNVTLTAVTNTTATKLNMYSDNTLVKSWSRGYTDNGTTRTWKVSYAFSGAGSRTLTFKAQDVNSALSLTKSATIVVAAKPTLSSVKFSAAAAAVNQNVTITAVTNPTATKLSMYSDGSLVKTWSSGYTDSGTTRTWKLTYAFSGAGNRTLSFKAQDVNAAVSDTKTAKITIVTDPTLSSAKFNASSAKVKQNVGITVVTNTSVSKICMYANGKQVKAWTSGYTDSGSKRTWKLSYAFSGAGQRTLSFKGFSPLGKATGEKTATITITK